MLHNGAIIRSKKDLAELLDEFGWFEDGHCLTLTPPPTEKMPPHRVELVLRDAGIGGFRPGDVRAYRAVKLTSTDVEEWSLEGGGEFFHSPQHCTEGAELIDLPDSFGLTLDVPSMIRLLARSFTFSDYPRYPKSSRPGQANGTCTLTRRVATFRRLAIGSPDWSTKAWRHTGEGMGTARLQWIGFRRRTTAAGSYSDRSGRPKATAVSCSERLTTGRGS